MKRIVFMALFLIAALCGGARASYPLSPLYEARLMATLAEWEAGAPAPAGHSDDSTWWPASANPASFCAGSLCAQSYCLGSVCLGSTCLGSGCIGSTCIGSGCAASLCGVSGCAGTTLCLKKCGPDGGPPYVIDPMDNHTTFHNGTCGEQ